MTAYPIVAPFDGTIVARMAVPSQRVEPTDAMFTLADLTTVRVTANVPESRVGLLLGKVKPTIGLTAEAYPGRKFEAMRDLRRRGGRPGDPDRRHPRRDAESRRPAPPGDVRRGSCSTRARRPPPLTVPAAAVVEIEGKAGVFRPGKEAGMFTFHPVVAGPEMNGRRAIASGLSEGDPVVVAGAFTLKSELVLQNETEEE